MPTSRRVRKSTATSQRVLVVDDSAPMRTTLRLLLAALDVDVIEAADGFEALRALQNASVGLIVCDHGMPGLDGRKLNHVLGAREDRPDVIVVSGDRPETEPAWAHDSVIGWLEKPFEAEAFLALVERALGLRRQTGS